MVDYFLLYRIVFCFAMLHSICRIVFIMLCYATSCCITSCVTLSDFIVHRFYTILLHILSWHTILCYIILYDAICHYTACYHEIYFSYCIILCYVFVFCMEYFDISYCTTVLYQVSLHCNVLYALCVLRVLYRISWQKILLYCIRFPSFIRYLFLVRGPVSQSIALYSTLQHSTA